MLNFILPLTLFVAIANACSVPYPPEGTISISQVQLLDASQFPDAVLLTISRVPSLDDSTSGPWCKIMNVLDGSVGDVVACADYAASTRGWTSPDVSNTVSVFCTDNCDSATATCIIERSNSPVGTQAITIADVPFLASMTATECANLITIGNVPLATAFTVESTSTVYLKFATNLVGIELYTTSTGELNHNKLSVNPVGGDWVYLSPNANAFGPMSSSASIYSSLSLLQNVAPYGLCEGYELYRYSIENDASGVYDEIITVNKTAFAGGYVDGVTQRVLKWGYSGDFVIVDDLGSSSATPVVTWQPDLCPMRIYCPTEEPTTSAPTTDEPTTTTARPTMTPTAKPTSSPTTTTARPTAKPTASPTTTTAKPSAKPTVSPTTTTTTRLTPIPTASPTTARPTTTTARPSATPTAILTTTARPTTPAPTTATSTTASSTTTSPTLTTTEATSTTEMEVTEFDITVASDSVEATSTQTQTQTSETGPGPDKSHAATLIGYVQFVLVFVAVFIGV